MKISILTMKRLPLYYRCVREMLGCDKLRTSSAELSEILRITPSQVRRDLNILGGAGQQGYGYNVRDLYQGLGNLLGVHSTLTAIMAGNSREDFASSFPNHPLFTARGVSLRAFFDENDTKNSLRGNLPVFPLSLMPDYIKSNNTDILILCTSKAKTYEAYEFALEAGIRGIWNFTNENLKSLSLNVPVLDTNFSDSLMTLCCMIKHFDNNISDGGDDKE